MTYREKIYSESQREGRRRGGDVYPCPHCCVNLLVTHMLLMFKQKNFCSNMCCWFPAKLTLQFLQGHVKPPAWRPCHVTMTTPGWYTRSPSVLLGLEGGGAKEREGEIERVGETPPKAPCVSAGDDQKGHRLTNS
jgi:hypothetical protein